MPRYFFKITNGQPYVDNEGEELRDDVHAWEAAKRLTRDIEDNLAPDGRWQVEVGDANGPLYLISVAARKLR